MKLKICTVLLLIFFASCSNKDYAYNEFTAAMYKSTSGHFEKSYQSLLDGKYETAYNFNNEFRDQNTITDARNIKKNTLSSLESINKVERTAETDKIHETITMYFEKVANDFTDQLNAYAAIDCDCPAQKDSIINVTKNLYKEISSLEDKALELQMEWMEKNGMKANPK